MYILTIPYSTWESPKIVEMCLYIYKGKQDNACSHKPFSLTSVLDKEVASPTSHLINKALKKS